jgi:hypothetical protein
MDETLKATIRTRALRIMAVDASLEPINAVRRAADAVMAEMRDPILQYNDKRLHAQLCWTMAQRDLSERKPETLPDRRVRANKTDRRVYAGRERMGADHRVRFPDYVYVGAATARGYVAKGSMAASVKRDVRKAEAQPTRAPVVRPMTIADMAASIHTGAND